MTVHITPVMLHHMPANIPDVCSKCLDDRWHLMGMFMEMYKDPKLLEGCYKMFVRNVKYVSR